MRVAPDALGADYVGAETGRQKSFEKNRCGSEEHEAGRASSSLRFVARPWTRRWRNDGKSDHQSARPERNC